MNRRGVRCILSPSAACNTYSSYSVDAVAVEVPVVELFAKECPAAWKMFSTESHLSRCLRALYVVLDDALASRANFHIGESGGSRFVRSRDFLDARLDRSCLQCRHPNRNKIDLFTFDLDSKYLANHELSVLLRFGFTIIMDLDVVMSPLWSGRGAGWNVT